ncbi:MAG: hypothetical protein AAFO96_15285 [Bacteroidota bacterium]
MNRINTFRAEVCAVSFMLSFLFCGIESSAQTSANGYVHTPKGEMHGLVIFVRFEDKSMMNGETAWPDRTEKGILPVFASGPENALFYADTKGFKGERVKNLSDFFYQMSHGQFLFTADIYPIQVPVKHIPLGGGNYFSRLRQMNEEAVRWIEENDPTFDWGKYDQRTNKRDFSSDNRGSKPDGILDYVMFMHRDYGMTGLGSPGNIAVNEGKWKIQTGHTFGESYNEPKHNWIQTLHEMAHNFFQAPHVMGANSADGNYFYTQKGWGMMAGWHSPFFVANAWEAWWLDWLPVRTITRSGTYVLKDYVSKGDAIRIPIGDTGDYLWLENHQKVDHWDQKLFYRNTSEGNISSAKGLYAYTVRSYGNDRSQPTLSPFQKAHVNMIRMHNGAGNFDYGFVDQQGNQKPHFKIESNPFAGQNDYQYIKLDYNQDGHVCVPRIHGNKDGRACEQQEVWSDFQNDSVFKTYANTGDGDDALVEKDEIGLSGIFPITNYPEFNPKEERLAPYVLTGISIQIKRQRGNGNLVLKVKMEDWEVRKSQRWCGDLFLPGGEEKQPLTLTSDTQINLSLSGTPNRRKVHPQTKTCSNPTLLEVGAGRQVVVEEGATLWIERNAELKLLEGAKLMLEPGSKLVVEGTLSMGEEGILEVMTGATWKVAGEGRLNYVRQNQIQNR